MGNQHGALDEAQKMAARRIALRLVKAETTPGATGTMLKKDLAARLGVDGSRITALVRDGATSASALIKLCRLARVQPLPLLERGEEIPEVEGSSIRARVDFEAMRARLVAGFQPSVVDAAVRAVDAIPAPDVTFEELKAFVDLVNDIKLPKEPKVYELPQVKPAGAAALFAAEAQAETRGERSPAKRKQRGG